MKLINLIKNELIKIFHKAGIYVMLLIVVVLSIIAVVLNKYLSVEDISNSFLVEVKMEDYDVKDPIQLENYVADKSNYETLKEISKYKYESPEYYYLDNNLYDVIYCQNRAKYIEKNEKKEKECSSEHEILLANAKNFDYKKVLLEEKAELVKELNKIGEDAELTELDYVKAKILVIDYRIDNNLPKTYTDSSKEIESYPDLYREYFSLDQNDKDYKNKEDLLVKKEKEKQLFEIKYKIDNKLYVSGKNYSLRDSIIYKFTTVDVFVLITVIMITGSILSEEFNKGTIKQLLVRPFSRSKILFSKLIASLIVFILFLLCYTVLDGIITAVGLGGVKEIFEPMIVYNYNKSAVVEYSLLTYCILSFLAILPKYLIIILFVFLVSIISTSSSVSMAAGYFLMFASSIIDSFKNIKIINYLPTSVWNFNDYLFGGMSSNPYGSLSSSIIIVIITIIFLIILSQFIFSKKNIKNQ
ncbi:MAG: ABC transporter permease subunit [Bacilli bacterium]|nr:ABC transporter permease subunit [Bacilli bacterium]